MTFIKSAIGEKSMMYFWWSLQTYLSTQPIETPLLTQLKLNQKTSTAVRKRSEKKTIDIRNINIKTNICQKDIFIAGDFELAGIK